LQSIGREYTCATPGIKLNDWLNEPFPSPEKEELLVRTFLVAIAVFAVFPLLLAQQTLNNDSVIKMVKMGFREDMIVNAINRSPGTYDTSPPGAPNLQIPILIPWAIDGTWLIASAEGFEVSELSTG
jgi:hypothetical protein